MINLKIEIDKNRILKKLNATGHSGFSVNGSDIVCAAVSVLLYTASLSLTKVQDAKIRNKDDGESLFIDVLGYETEGIEKLKGITLFLLNGLNLLKTKYETYIDLFINESND